jgi:hypothetical protein
MQRLTVLDAPAQGNLFVLEMADPSARLPDPS